MLKRLLKTEEDFYKVLDEIYNLIPDDNICKAIYKDKEEQYGYQTYDVNKPTLYPCMMVFNVMKSNYSNYMQPHLYNKEYYFINSEEYITLDDFNKK